MKTTQADFHPRIRIMSPLLIVSDLNNSIEFYKSQLNFEVDFIYEDFYAGINKDGFSIHLKSGTPSPEERQNKRKDQHLDILFSVEDIENLYKDLSDKPVEITQSIRDMPYGKEFYIADPDGNILGFLE